MNSSVGVALIAATSALGGAGLTTLGSWLTSRHTLTTVDKQLKAEQSRDSKKREDEAKQAAAEARSARATTVSNDETSLLVELSSAVEMAGRLEDWLGTPDHERGKYEEASAEVSGQEARLRLAGAKVMRQSSSGIAYEADMAVNQMLTALREVRLQMRDEAPTPVLYATGSLEPAAQYIRGYMDALRRKDERGSLEY